MINVMSLEPGHRLSGKAINDWCINQIINNGSHVKDARRLFRKNYHDNREYEVIRIPADSGVNASNILVFMKVT